MVTLWVKDCMFAVNNCGATGGIFVGTVMGRFWLAARTAEHRTTSPEHHTSKC